MDDFHGHVCEPLTPDWGEMLGKAPFNGADMLPKNLDRDQSSLTAAEEPLQLSGIQGAGAGNVRHFCGCSNFLVGKVGFL